jgi:hypothetical protein
MEYAQTEAFLTALPQVKQAVVVLHGAIDQQLAAYLVAEPGCAVNPAGFGRQLLARLPDAAVPDVYVVIDSLPRGEDGEPDMELLSRATRGRHATGCLVPQVLSGPAADVADIWREVLGVAAIGLCDDLFDLGGHSLTITRIATRIRARLDVDVPLTVFYDTPTILAVASVVERARQNRASA